MKDLGIKVSFYTLIGNILLSAFKLFAGIAGASAAMVADGLHSLSDVFTTIIVMFSLKVANKPADEEHPYGHGRAESIASKILGLALMVVAVGVAKNGIESLILGSEAPEKIALIAAIISIVVKEVMYQATISVGKKTQSKALVASAWHHRSDAYSSVGTLVGIFAARRGWYFMDGVGALIVSVLIFKMGWEIWKKTVEELMDTQKSGDGRELIEAICQRENVILKEDLLRLRHYGNKIYAEMTIVVPGELSVTEAHDRSECIRSNLLNEIPNLEDVIIHVDPRETDYKELSKSTVC